MRNSGVPLAELAVKRGDGAPEDDAFSALLSRNDLTEESKVARPPQRACTAGPQRLRGSR